MAEIRAGRPRDPPRVALIHAVRTAVDPIEAAFGRIWPEARLHNLLDDSLSKDLARAGRLEPAMTERFLALSHYCAHAGAAGILFTCSAFNGPIDTCKRRLAVPVLKPDEAMYERALAAGDRLGVLVTFQATIASCREQMAALATAQGRAPTVEVRLVPGALEALLGDDAERHDALIAEAAAALPPCDSVLLAQFSMARAAPRVCERVRVPVLTSPDAAVEKLKSLLCP